MRHPRTWRLLGAGLIMMSLLAGCGTAGGEPATGDVIHGVADVEEVDVLIMESFPVQVSAVARGSLRDGCTQIHEVRTRFEEGSQTFVVEITTVRDADAVCTQALVPFEERVELEVRGLPAGTYTVEVNGVRETFTLAVDNVAPDTSEGQVSWDRARALILSGQVEQVTQLHSLEVTLQLRDGTQLVTTEPEIDAVFEAVDACGEPCSDMVLITE